MAKVRLDRVLMCSLFESFKNYRADDPLLEFSITTSGSIPPGGKNFEHTVSFERTGTISDIYYKLSTANYKRPLNILGRAVDTASGEIISPYVIYSSSSVTVGLSVQNFGGSPYTLLSETWDFEIKLFDAPIVN